MESVVCLTQVEIGRILWHFSSLRIVELKELVPGSYYGVKAFCVLVQSSEAVYDVLVHVCWVVPK